MDVAFEVAVFARHLAAAPHGIESAQVCVLGNADEIGAWDSRQAVPMELVEGSTAEKKYAATVRFPVASEFFPLEYKYIIKDAQVGEVVSWEAIPGNRTLTLTRAANVALNKPAKQSSTYTAGSMPCPGSRAASLANNGNHNGFQEWRCARTTREENPWWSVDLKTAVALSRLNLWKAMTYHEQPKRADALPPASSVATARTPSAWPPPPVWVFVSTEDLSTKSGADLFKLVLAPDYLPESTKVFKLELHEDFRVESLDLGGVKARFLRIQYESVKVATQFSEVEVFSKESTKVDESAVKMDDGFFGVEAASDGDLQEYIDSEWVDPRGDRALVRLWIGSFRKDVPAIQWFDGSVNTRPIHADARHQLQHHTETTDGPKLVVQDLPVDARGASLLDKDAPEFREGLAAVVHHTHRDLMPYTNSTGASSVEKWLELFAHTHFLDETELAQLKTHAKIRTFRDREALLHYGQRTRAAFFVIQGEVQVMGPPTATGSIALGCVQAGAAINDLGLFSSWPERSAGFEARGEVFAQVLTYEDLVQILGEKKLRLLRHQLVRERHALDSTTGTDQNGKLRVVDASNAQVFRTKVPTTSLTKTDASAVHRMSIDLFEAADVGTSIASNTQKGHLLGSAPLLPTQFRQHGEGFLTLPILSKTDGTEDVTIVGQVTVHYLVVRPFVHARNNLSTVWRSYWRERAPIGGGHRGMGRHFNQVGDFRKALTRENTLASFVLAGRNGADFVEFDVQLTKDHVPVLYHDFIFRIGLEDKRAWSQGARAEHHDVAIHQLTLRELTRSQTSVIPKKDPPALKRLIKKHWHSILGRSTAPKKTVDAGRGTVGVVERDDEHLVDFYPRLEDLLKHVPPEIGLNIEIKYPDPFKRASYRFSPSFAMDYYVDKILQCVFDHAGAGRRIFFSCFDPDLVVALLAKQATYPVFFLTYGRVQPPVVDARLTLQFAHNFAKMEKLRGIVSNSDEFLVAPQCAELVRRDGLVLMTWGDQNTSHECVQLQKRHAIDGVISDNIGDLTREDRKGTAAAATHASSSSS